MQTQLDERKKKFTISKKKLTEINPLLKKPSTDVERNVENGIDQIIPDPDDIPGGDTIGGGNPDILQSILRAAVDEKCAQMASQMKKKTTSRKKND